jgi:DNA-binding transcriptional ArsR family regulator
MRRDVFHAIADPTRRDILISLIKTDQNVNALAEKYSMTRQAVSLHIKILEECGIIAIQQQGRERYCKLKPRKLEKVAAWLAPFQKMWGDRFSRLDDLLKEE